MAIEDDFDEIGSRWINDAFNTKASDIPPIVYHYTDAVGLRGMLRRNSIWATDTRFLNDREELKHFISAAAKHVKEKASNCDDDILKSLYQSIERYRSLPSPNAYFVFSLSSEKDDLSQWRGYANDGCGFTIGLSGPILHDLSNINKSFGFTSVEYDYSKQNLIIQRALKEIEELTKKLMSENNDSNKVYNTAASKLRLDC